MRTMRSIDGRAEPAEQVVVQIPLALTDPRDVAVGAYQDGRDIQCRRGVCDQIDPIRPTWHRREIVRHQ